MQHCPKSLHLSPDIQFAVIKRTRRFYIMKIFSFLLAGAAVFGQLQYQAKSERDEFKGSFSSLTENCADKEGCNDLPPTMSDTIITDVLRSKRARLYSNESDTKNNLLKSVRQALEKFNEEDSNVEPETARLKGYKTVPRYKKFLVRMNPLEAVRLKSAGSSGAKTNHEGPLLSDLGNDELKTLFIVEHILSERGLYHVQERPHAEKGGMSFTFYTKPTGDFRDLVYICKLTREIPRWSVLKKPCDSSDGMAYGYKAYVSFSLVDDSTKITVANNRAVGMPFGTRASIDAPCCSGQKFQGFAPCCLYRHDPFEIYIPSGYSKWSQWSTCDASCDGGVQTRSRHCTGKCSEPALETRSCNTLPCNPVGWAQWSEWGECTVTCGGGKRLRDRICLDICPNNRNYHKEAGACANEPCFLKNVWAEWSEWSACSATCAVGRTQRTKQCTDGPCLTDASQVAPSEWKECMERFCHGWSEWNEWSGCSRNCAGGHRLRKRTCEGGIVGLQGCPGLDAERGICNTEECDLSDEDYYDYNDFGIRIAYDPEELNGFQQDCLDFHNFYRALHNVAPLSWDAQLFESAKKWSKELIARAPETPKIILKGRTPNWPHSFIGGPFRSSDVGENIAWDLSKDGASCRDSVSRWYSEMFYFNPKTPLQGRRGDAPTGHLTQMLWKQSTLVGCARTMKLVKQPKGTYPKYLRSGYTVCHYGPQGNIVETMLDNWSDKKPEYCSTYDNESGANQCASSGNCQGLDTSTRCGCWERKKLTPVVVTPLCVGKCLVECENQWGTVNFYPEKCIGENFCTCTKSGALCK